VNRVKFSDDVYSKVGELRFRFTELEDELKDGYITLKVRLFFFAVYISMLQLEFGAIGMNGIHTG